MSAAERRAACAALVIVAAVALACFVQIAIDKGLPAGFSRPRSEGGYSAGQKAADGALSSEEAASTAPDDQAAPLGMAAQVFAQLGGVSAYEAGVPAAFAEEVLDPSDCLGATAVYVQDIVCLILPLSSQDAQETIRSHAAAQGWEAWDDSGSFGKDDGVYRWMFVCVTQRSDGCTAVFYLQRREG